MDVNTIGDLRRMAGRQLGYGRDPANWSTNQVADIWDCMRSGLHNFYYPPRTHDGAPSYQWSFLKPLGTINLTAGVIDYDLPETFAHIVGAMYYVQEDFASKTIKMVNEARILHLRQREAYNIVNYYPQFAAITPIVSDQSGNQRYRVMFWPSPDQAYTIRFRYMARTDIIQNDGAVPLGGPEHFETVLASVLARCEIFMDDVKGELYKDFMERLQASIDLDRKLSSPETLGYNADPSDKPDVGYIRSTRLTTYEKYPL